MALFMLTWLVRRLRKISPRLLHSIVSYGKFVSVKQELILNEILQERICHVSQSLGIRRGADKSLAFPLSLFATQPKEFFLDGLKKLEQRSHKCVELRGEYWYVE
jgi:hypothetical protein